MSKVRNLAVLAGAAGLATYLNNRKDMNRPIESIADAQRRAKKRLPAPIYKALISGNEKGVTMNANVDAFSEIGWRPTVARETYEEQPLERDLSSTALGIDMSVPFMIGPAGAQAVDPHAEVSVAKAAKTVGTAIGLSSFATKPIEEVVAANENTFYQLYWTGSKEDILWRVNRAKKAGAKALIVTLDATGGGLGRRDWDSPPTPAQIDLKTMIQFAPMALGSLGWISRFLVNGGIPNLSVPNSANNHQDILPFSAVYAELMSTQVPTWDDVKWLGEQWGGKFVVKGIYRPEEARRAVEAGADAVVVSNHGGNNLDTTYATIRVLPAIKKEIGDDAEIWFDGGVRRGMDVAKALALGADTVLLGRAWLWGLAAGGEQGVLDVLRMFEDGLHWSLVGLGHKSIKELSPDDLTVPDGFFVE